MGLANTQYDSQGKTKTKKPNLSSIPDLTKKGKWDSKNLSICAQITSKKKMFVDHILFSFIMSVVLKL